MDWWCRLSRSMTKSEGNGLRFFSVSWTRMDEDVGKGCCCRSVREASVVTKHRMITASSCTDSFSSYGLILLLKLVQFKCYSAKLWNIIFHMYTIRRLPDVKFSHVYMVNGVKRTTFFDWSCSGSNVTGYGAKLWNIIFHMHTVRDLPTAWCKMLPCLYGKWSKADLCCGLVA